jgi:hypothetical protein
MSVIVTALIFCLMESRKALAAPLKTSFSSSPKAVGRYFCLPNAVPGSSGRDAPGGNARPVEDGPIADRRAWRGGAKIQRG